MTWDDVSIKQWLRIKEIFGKDEHPLSMYLESCAYLMGVEHSYLMNLPKSECDKLIEPYSFLSSLPKPRKVSSWEGFRFVYDVKQANAGNVIDVDELNARGDVDLADLMAVLSIKDGMPFNDRREYLLNNMPIPLALGVHDFFLRVTQRRVRRLRRYLAVMSAVLKIVVWLRMIPTKVRQRLNTFFGGSLSSKK